MFAVLAASLALGIPLAVALPEDERARRPGRRGDLRVRALGRAARARSARGGRDHRSPAHGRVVHRGALPARQTPPDVHLDHHGHLRGRDRRGRVADHHGAVGDERLRAHLARRDHRQPRALHRAERPRSVRRLRGGARHGHEHRGRGRGVSLSRCGGHGARRRGRDRRGAPARRRPRARREGDRPPRRPRRRLAREPRARERPTPTRRRS